MPDCIWYETPKQKRDRLRRQRLRNEKRRANQTPEERARRLEGLRKARETKCETALNNESDPKTADRLKKYSRRLRDRCTIRYNCETLEQYGKRVRRNRNRVNTLPRDLALLKDTRDFKEKGRSDGKAKKKGIKIKKEPVPVDEEYHEVREELESEETPEEFMERKRYNFMCMELQLQINKASQDFKNERRKTTKLAEQLDKMHTRAKELQDFYGIPICSSKMYKYHLSSLFLD